MRLNGPPVFSVPIVYPVAFALPSSYACFPVILIFLVLLIVLLVIPVLSLDEPQNQMINPPEHGKYQEHADESQHPEHDIGKFHLPGVRHPLPDFNGERDDDDQGEYINPADDHDVVVLDQPFEQRMHHEYHGHPQGPDNQKVELLIGKIVFVCVIHFQQITMYLSNHLHNRVQKCFHIQPP